MDGTTSTNLHERMGQIGLFDNQDPFSTNSLMFIFTEGSQADIQQGLNKILEKIQDQENRLDPEQNLFGTDKEIAFTQNDLIKQAIIETDFTAPYFNQDGSIVEKADSKKKNFIFNLKTLFASSIPVESNTIENLLLQNENNNILKQERTNYEPTDEFRTIQKESRGLPIKTIESYHKGQIDEGIRERVSRVLQSQLEHYRSGLSNDDGLLKLGNFNLIPNVDSNLFHDVFEIAKTYTQNGELVDLHDDYNDCKCYLSDEGTSGFAITPDGDLVSVFNLGIKKGFLRSIAPIIKEQAKTLDCYVSPNQNLQEMYRDKFGFKTTSVMDYNMEYDHDDIAKNHNMPQVAFMINTDKEVETKHFNKDQYDEAKDYQQSFIDTKEIYHQTAKPDYSVQNDFLGKTELVIDKKHYKEAKRLEKFKQDNKILEIKPDLEQKEYFNIGLDDYNSNDKNSFLISEILPDYYRKRVEKANEFIESKQGFLYDILNKYNKLQTFKTERKLRNVLNDVLDQERKTKTNYEILTEIVGKEKADADIIQWGRIIQSAKEREINNIFYKETRELVKNVLKDNGMIIAGESDSLKSDSKYIYAIPKDGGRFDGIKIRISDHDTYVNYGENLNLYTTDNIENMLDRLSKFVKNKEGLLNSRLLSQESRQKKTINGYFDSDLKVIVLGENLNNGTLPHEMAHFFLDRTFELWRDNQGTKEFRNYFDRIAETLNISKDQYKLTTEQQEKWARMTEAYLFGMGIPEGQKGIFDLFYKWRPSQYKGIQDLH